MSLPVIAIFDIGKTNQKLFLFDEDYRVVFEKSVHLPEIKDEDGFPCEDVVALSDWVTSSLAELLEKREFQIKAFNVSAHGASFVNVGENGKPVTLLYNYLKPYPGPLQKKFYQTYGGDQLAMQTASPILGNLNSGLQLYWLKQQRPEMFRKIKYALHLPEYISFLVTGKAVSGITSIGCHTQLWGFSQNNYAHWVHAEGIAEKLAPLFPSEQAIKTQFHNHEILCGTGLHDSSAALIPYLKTFSNPFVLLSTGTWNIGLNPFNSSPLTIEELQQDCLCYLTFEGKPVKASRLFAGHDHDELVKSLSYQFNVSEDHYRQVKYNPDLIDNAKPSSFEGAYHQLLVRLVAKQISSLHLIFNSANAGTLFVDGGFCENEIFMKLLTKALPMQEIFAAELHQASALGAALAIHAAWNKRPLPNQLISLKKPT